MLKKLEFVRVVQNAQIQDAKQWTNKAYIDAFKEDMMKYFRIPFILILVFAIIGCASSSYVKVKQGKTPYYRPGFTVLSPQGDGWVFNETDRIGQHDLFFGFPQTSRTHTLYARIVETPSNATFTTPEEFRTYIQRLTQIGIDQRRYKIVKEDIKLDNKFGEYSVSNYSVIEDHGARQLSGTDVPYLLMETFNYTFIHPYNKKLIISVIYSQRGKSDELDKDFMEKAKAFIDGIELKK